MPQRALYPVPEGFGEGGALSALLSRLGVSEDKAREAEVGLDLTGLLGMLGMTPAAFLTRIRRTPTTLRADIADDAGNVLGPLFASLGKDKALTIPAMSAGGKGRLGHKGVKQIFEQLLNLFPEAERIAGRRVSGATRGAKTARSVDISGRR